MYKTYIHTTNLYGKNYKTSKHKNKLHILQKYAIKINILKLSSNKKIKIFAYLMWIILKKYWIRIGDADRTWGG